MKIDTAMLAQLKKTLDKNTQAVTDLTNFLRVQQAQELDWCSGDEAAKLLGMKLTKSGTHRRRVAWLAKQGFIPRFRAGNPYMYWRDDVKVLSPKIASGEVILPSSF